MNGAAISPKQGSQANGPPMSSKKPSKSSNGSAPSQLSMLLHCAGPGTSASPTRQPHKKGAGANAMAGTLHGKAATWTTQLKVHAMHNKV